MGGGLVQGGGIGRVCLRGACHYQNIFPPGVGLCIVGGGLGQGGLPDLLVQFGQLPAEGDAAFPAKGGGQLVQGGPQPVGRFVKDDGARLPFQGGQPFAAQTAFGGQEPLKDPAGGVLARHGQSGDAGRGPRHRRDGDPPGQGVPDDDRPGVRDAGHPRIRTQGAILPRFDPAQDALAPVQSVLVVADHRLFQPQMVEQTHGDPGVLGGDKVCRPKSRCRPRGHIFQIADGGGDDVQRSGHNTSSVSPRGLVHIVRPRR